MSQLATPQALDNVHVVDSVHVPEPAPAVDAPPAPPASTLGQTPHEPAVRPWELELLISGALVFSLLQLPGQLDGWFNGVRPRLDATWFMAAFMAWFYVKLALYALVGGFIAHLCVRGYWVGVIGIEAVFPNGIVWDRMRSGPIMREITRRRTPSLQTLIDRADRLASMIFGGAFGLALMFAYFLVVGAMLVAGTAVLSHWFIRSAETALVVSEVVLFTLLGPVMLAALVDRRMGDRLDPNGRAARVIRRIGGASGRLGMNVLFMPLLFTLLTNLRTRRHGSVLALVITAFVGLVMVKDVLIPRGVIHSDGYDFLPRGGGALTVGHAFYGDQRGGDADELKLPEIQSDIIRDPYVRLFIPYSPRRHNALIARRCPGVSAAAAAQNDAGRQAVLRCMAQLQPVTLDGKPTNPSWRFYTHPQTGIRGIIAYLPVAGLPKGENQLTVAALPDPDDKPDAAPPQPYVIPFWL